MEPQSTRDYVRFHIDTSLHALELLSDAERPELSFDIAADLAEAAHNAIAETLPASINLRMMTAIEELRACSISERNRRESVVVRAITHRS